jgi:hypothetical protein
MIIGDNEGSNDSINKEGRQAIAPRCKRPALFAMRSEKTKGPARWRRGVLNTENQYFLEKGDIQ